MGKYRSINTRIWLDDKFTTLADDEKLLLLYVLTSQQTNSLGVWRFSLGLAAEEIGWDLVDLKRTLKRLLQHVDGMVKYDARESIMYLPNWLRYNWPRSPNVVRGWSRVFVDFSPCSLLGEWHEHALELMQKRSVAYVRAFEEVTNPYKALFIQGLKSFESLSKDFAKVFGCIDQQDLITIQDKNNIEEENKKFNLEIVRSSLPRTRPRPADPPGGQERLVDGKLAGKNRYTGSHPLWYDWLDRRFVWASAEARVEETCRWKERYPNVPIDMTMTKIASWMDSRPTSARGKRNLVKWVERQWFLKDQERAVASTRTVVSRASVGTKQQEHEGDDWDGVAEA